MDRKIARQSSLSALVAGGTLCVTMPASAGLPDQDVAGIPQESVCSVLAASPDHATRWHGAVDHDGDGVADDADADDDGDGIPDRVEGSSDRDGDGLAASLDLDADGDGIPDAIEAIPSAGWADAGGAATLAPGLADTDGDGHPDAYDADADGDRLPDALEAGFGVFAPVDVDRDGLADDVDVDPCGFGPIDAALRAPLAFFPDVDGDARSGGDVDWRDPTTDAAAAVDTGLLVIPAATAAELSDLRDAPRPPALAPSDEGASLDPNFDGQEEDMGIHSASGCSTSGRPGGLGGVLLAALALGASRRKGALLAAVGLLAVPGLASAQDRPRLDINSFDQNAQTATFTLVRDAQQAERGTVSGDLTTTYGLNPLEYEDNDDIRPRGDVVDHLVGLNLGFNAAATNWLEIGFNMPVVQSVFYDGAAGENTVIGFGGSGDHIGVGDMSLQIGLAPLQQRKGAPFNLSLVPRIVIPTGSRDILTGTGSVQVGADAAIGAGWEHFRFSVNGGYLWQDDSRRVGDIYEDDKARWGLALATPFMDNQLEPQLEYVGSHVVTDDARDAVPDFDWHRHTPMQLLAGITWRPNDLPLYIKGGAGPGLTQGFGVADVNVFLTVGARTLPRRVAQVAAITDADGDGIADEFDVCPYKAEDLDGFQDSDGCPDLDNDNDGIADASDACVNRPEVFNDYEDVDGCPDEVASAVEIEDQQIVLYDKIYFEYDRAELRPVSKRVLDEVVSTLKSHPEIQTIDLEGHADERGSQWYNVELSRQRAQSVRNYLIAQGIDADRLRIQAYGEEAPAIADADDEAEYAQNRRVHLKVQMTDGGLALDDIRTVDADVPAIPEGFDPPNTDNDVPGQDVNVPMAG